MITGKVCCQHSREFLYFKPAGIWKRSTVLFFPYLTDTADYTFKLSLITYTVFVNENVKAKVAFWEKADHFAILNTGMIEPGASLEFSFGQTAGGLWDPRRDGFIFPHC